MCNDNFVSYIAVIDININIINLIVYPPSFPYDHQHQHQHQASGVQRRRGDGDLFAACIIPVIIIMLVENYNKGSRCSKAKR